MEKVKVDGALTCCSVLINKKGNIWAGPVGGWKGEWVGVGGGGVSVHGNQAELVSNHQGSRGLAKLSWYLKQGEV